MVEYCVNVSENAFTAKKWMFSNAPNHAISLLKARTVSFKTDGNLLITGRFKKVS